MNKIVSTSDFAANVHQILDALQQDGEAVLIVRNGRVVAELTPGDAPCPALSGYGMLRNDEYRFDADPGEPAFDPAGWDAGNSAPLYGAT